MEWVCLNDDPERDQMIMFPCSSELTIWFPLEAKSQIGYLCPDKRQKGIIKGFIFISHLIKKKNQCFADSLPNQCLSQFLK